MKSGDIYVEVVSSAADMGDSVELEALGLIELSEATMLLLHFAESSKWASIVGTDQTGRVLIDLDGNRWWISRRFEGHGGAPPLAARSFWRVEGREAE